MKRVPSLIRIVQVDYLASIGVIAPAVMWAMVLVTHFLDREAAAFFLLLAPAVTVAGLAAMAWRAWTIRSTFGNGIELPGIVSGADFFRGRGRVEVVYTLQGKKVQSGNAVQSTGITRSLAPGQEVTVLVHPSKPKRAFVRELYL